MRRIKLLSWGVVVLVFLSCEQPVGDAGATTNGVADEPGYERTELVLIHRDAVHYPGGMVRVTSATYVSPYDVETIEIKNTGTRRVTFTGDEKVELTGEHFFRVDSDPPVSFTSSSIFTIHTQPSVDYLDPGESATFITQLLVDWTGSDLVATMLATANIVVEDEDGTEMTFPFQFSTDITYFLP